MKILKKMFQSNKEDAVRHPEPPRWSKEMTDMVRHLIKDADVFDEVIKEDEDTFVSGGFLSPVTEHTSSRSTERKRKMVNKDFTILFVESQTILFPSGRGGHIPTTSRMVFVKVTNKKEKVFTVGNEADFKNIEDAWDERIQRHKKETEIKQVDASDFVEKTKE